MFNQEFVQLLLDESGGEVCSVMPPFLVFGLLFIFLFFGF